MFSFWLRNTPGLILLISFICLSLSATSARQYSWEIIKSAEEGDYDPDYDPFPDGIDYKVDTNHHKIEPKKVCGKSKVCACEKGAENILKCSKAGLQDAFLEIEGSPFGKGSGVTVANLDHNDIVYLFKRKVLPGTEHTVRKLDLSGNDIADIEPGAFDPFANLLELKLTNNNLDEQTMSKDIFTPALSGLHQLYLDYNFLGKLDDGVFDNLKNLKKLVLDGNKNLNISSRVFTKALSNLETLSLDRCGIKELDKDVFANLPNLKYLSLAGNPLNEVPAALSKVPHLTLLDMSDTHLSELDANQLQETVPKLQNFYMRKMRYLWKIGDCAFCGLPDLKSVDFSDSKYLRMIQPGAFGTKFPKGIDRMNFRHCNLSSLNSKLLSSSYWASMSELKLEGNPWICDCNLKWLMENKPAMRTAAQLNSPICASPKEVKGMSLLEAVKTVDVCEKKVPAKADSVSHMGTFAVGIFSMLLIAAIAVVGIVYARRRYSLGSGFNFRVINGGTPRIPSPSQMGYTGGRTIFEDDVEEEEGQGAQQQNGHGGHDVVRPEFV